jgi:hypothetical protein
LLNLLADVRKSKLAQLAATEYLIVGDIRKRKRRFRKVVKLFI